MSRPWDGPAFGVGTNVGAAEFRHSDTQGRPIDPHAETPTQRDERVRQLQDMRLAQGPREAPPADAASVLSEWMALSPANRMSNFARVMAEQPGRLPEAEAYTETSVPRPGGLLERLGNIRRRRGSVA